MYRWHRRDYAITSLDILAKAKTVGYILLWVIQTAAHSQEQHKPLFECKSCVLGEELAICPQEPRSVAHVTIHHHLGACQGALENQTVSQSVRTNMCQSVQSRVIKSSRSGQQNDKHTLFVM